MIVDRPITCPEDLMRVRQMLSQSELLDISIETHDESYVITTKYRGRSLVFTTGRLPNEEMTVTKDSIISWLHTRCVVMLKHKTLEDFAKIWDVSLRDPKYKLKTEDLDHYRPMYDEWLKCLHWCVTVFGKNFATTWS